MTDLQGYKQQHSETVYKYFFPEWQGNNKNINCFAHADEKPSLSIYRKNGEYRHHCHACGISGDCLNIIAAKENIVDIGHQIGRLKEIARITEPKKKIVKIYDYTDETGNLIFQTVRYDPKDFKQRRPDPDNKGKWIYDLKGIQTILYNLPEVIKSKYAFILEGEKDVETFKELGLIATCNPLGAGKWRPDYNEYLKGKRVVIIPDNDKPGRDHTLQVAKNLKGIAESVKVVELPDLPDKGDVSDWLTQGGTKEALIELIKQAPEWEEPPSQFHDTYSTREAVKLKVSTLQDILDYEDPTYLIEPILIEKTLAILSAYAGTYKSLLSLFIAFSVITGRKLFDFFNVSKCGRVLIIDEENPGSFIKERLIQIGFTNDMPISFLHFQKVKLDRLDCFKELIQIIKDLKPTLIIFDSLIRFHNAKENETSEMALVMEKLRDIVNLGITVLVIHHHRKGAGDRKELLRGSSDILGGVDMHLSIEDKGDYLILSSPKTRTKPFDPIRLKLDSIENSLTFRYVGKELNENQIILDEIADILKDNIALGVKEILEELKSKDYEIGQNRLREILQSATGKELTETTGDRGKKFYSLNPTFTASRVLYKGGNCETENKPNNDFHSFTEEAPLNCETNKQEVIDLTGDDVEIVL